MKKVLTAVFTATLLVCLSLAVSINAFASTPVEDDYTFSGACTVYNTQSGGIFSADMGEHATIAEVKINATLDATEDAYVNFKGYVENIYRIKFNYAFTDEDTVTLESRIFDTSSSSSAITTLSEDGYFEVHYKLPDEFFTKELHKFQFQVYIASGVEGPYNFELLGLAFDADGTWSDFSAKQGGGASNAPVISEEYTVSTDSATVNGTTVTYVDADETNVDVLTDNETTLTYVSVPVENYEPAYGGYVSFKYTANGINALGLHIQYEDADGVTGEEYVAQCITAGWNVKGNYYDDAGYGIITANIGSYIEAHSKVTALIFKVNNTSGATLDISEIQITADGNHKIAIPSDGNLSISDIVAPSSASIVKDETTGYQTVTYSTSPGWSTFDFNINNYQQQGPANILEVVIYASDTVAICFQINDAIDWSIGHQDYAGGRVVTIQLDLSANGAYGTLPGDFFSVKMYLDASKTVESEKTIEFRSITIKEPDPEPTGCYIGKPQASGMACVESSAGWDVSYNGDESSWRNVAFTVNNYETDYDILVINTRAVEGMNLGVRIYWLVEVDGEFVELHNDIRNHHDNDEGIFTESGEVALVFFMEAYGVKGSQITKFELYFDPPTGRYTPNAGEQSTTISSVELMKSSEIDFEDLTITFNDTTVDYTGEEAVLDITTSDEVALKYSYLRADGDTWYDGIPVGAGTYTVKASYLGSLTYNCQEVTATLVINKVKATIADDAVTVDADTRIVTVANGVIASTDSEFTEGFDVVSGDEVAYGTTIYYKVAENDNYFESDVKSLVVNRPVDDGNNNQQGGNDNQQGGNTETGKKGCNGSISLGFGGAVALVACAFVGLNKKRNKK